MNLPATLQQHQADDRCCHVLEEVASCRRDTLDFVLSVRTLEAHYRQHNTLVFLSRRRAAKIFTCFSKQSLVLLVIGWQEQTTAIQTPTLVADKNLAASKPANTPTGWHKAKMVTPTYTVVLLLLWRYVSCTSETSCQLAARHGVPLSLQMQTLYFHVTLERSVTYQ